MRTKAVIQKIAALGTGIAMMGATFMGAMAADLNNYPGMFLLDHKFNAAIVVGNDAASSDVVGAIDLGASLQFAAREEKTISVGGTTAISASSGAEVIATGNHLTLAEAMNTVKATLKKENLPTLLADGTVTNDNTNKDYDYSQKLAPAADTVKFGNADKDEFGNVPRIYLDQAAGEAYTLTVDFDTAFDASDLNNSEKITIAGTTFTFDPTMLAEETDLVMYASDKTETIAVGATKEIVLSDGTKITMELVGANSDKDTATLKVNGKQYSVEKGETITNNDIYINDVFTYNIPVSGAAVEFFVGSKKVTIDASGSYNDVDVEGETLTGMTAQVTSTGNNISAITQIDFKYTPSEQEDDQYKYLFIGESIKDPLFETFKMDFGGMTPDLKDAQKTRISLTRSSSDYTLSFTNKDGEAYSFKLFHSDSGSAVVEYYEDFAHAATNITQDQYFILTEGTDVTKVYKLSQVVTEDSVDYAKLKDLTDNSELKLKVNDAIGDATTTITDMNNNPDRITLSAASKLVAFTQGDGNITISSNVTDETLYDLTFTEGITNFDDLVAGDKQIFKVNVTGDSTDGDQDITIAGLAVGTAGNWNEKSDEDNDIQYGVSKFGTYVERERENYGDYIDFYYPVEEQSFHVFFTPIGATISTTPGGDTVTYYEYNKINAAAKLASEIADVKAQNLIVVGGPCINKAAFELMGQPAVCTDGFQEGKAILKLIENGDKVALLVAGYSAADTRRATAVLANYGSYKLSGKEMVVTGTSMTDITVSAPTTQ